MSGRQNKNIPTIQHRSNQADPALRKNGSFEIPKWAPLVVLIFTGILYSKALLNGLTSIDDDFYVTNNPFLRDFSSHGIKTIFTSFYATNYHPFTTLTFFIEFNCWGLNPLPYHLLNVLLHLLNTWLVFKLAQRLSSSDITALLVCTLFAIHPMHVESVAWVSERKDVLYTAFYLSAVLFYLEYLESGLRMKYYFIVAAFFLAALLSKSAAVTLPVLLFAIDVYKGRLINGRSLIEKGPLLMLSVLFGILAILSQRAGGAVNEYAASYSYVSRFFIFTSGLAFYLLKIIAPVRLSILHYSPYVLGENLNWQYYASLPFLLFIAFLVVRVKQMRKEIMFGVFFFLITISVMLQMVPVGSAYVAERYSYVPYIGLFYIAGQWVSRVGIIKWRSMVIGVLSLVVIIFSILTWNRIGVWKDDTNLYNDLVDTNPEIYYSYYLRANIEKTQGDLKAAIDDYSRSIQLNPSFVDGYNKRSRLYDATGNIKQAIPDYTMVIQFTPAYAQAYNNRGWDYYQLGDRKAAMLDYNKAISLDTGNAEAYNNRGWAYYQSGDVTSAIPDFDKAILLIPQFDRPRYNRGEIRLNAGDFKGAAEDFSVLIQVHKNDHMSYYMRGLARFGLGDASGACQDWQKATELGNRKAAEVALQNCH